MAFFVLESGVDPEARAHVRAIREGLSIVDGKLQRLYRDQQLDSDILRDYEDEMEVEYPLEW